MHESKHRTRVDYRSEQPGTTRYYLIHEQPKGITFSRGVKTDRSQLHDTHRDQGRFTALDESGHLEMNHAFLNELDGIPAWKWDEALKEIETWEGLKVPGELLVKCLRWYQNARINQARGYSMIKFAMDHGTSKSAVQRNAYQCCEYAENLIFTNKVA